MTKRIGRLLGVALLLSTASLSHAQVTGKWDLASGFWTDHVTPSIGATNDLAILSGNIAGGRTITNDTSVSLGAMYIGYQGANARAINLRPQGDAAITFTNLTGGVAWLVKTNNANVAGSATDTIFTPIVLGSDLAVSNRSTYGGLTLSGAISEVGGSRALYVGSSVSGSNRVTLTGDNSFSGGVFLRSGALQLGHVNALGTGALTLYGGGLGTTADLSGGLGVTNAIVLAANGVVSNMNALQLSGTIGGAFSLAKWGTAALTLSGSNSFSGGSSLRAGTLLLGNADALGTAALTINGGVLGASADLSAGTGVTNAIVLGAAGIVSNVNALQLSGNISGAFSLTKKAAGTLTLSGVNTFGGPVVVSNGTAVFARQVALYNNTPASWTEANIVVATGATLGLAVGGAGQFTASDVQTIAALGTGSGGFANGSFLGLDTAAGDFAYNNVIANPNGGANALGLVKLGANGLTLGVANTYTGGTVVNNGTLRIGLDEALADTGPLTVNNGGTFDLNGYDETVWYLAGTAGGVITNSGAMADLILDLQNCNNRAASMDIRGDLRLVVRNSQTIRSATTADQDYQQLNGTNTFTGGVVIDAGALRANNDLALGAVPGAPDADAIILKNNGALLGTATYDLDIHPNRGIFLESGTGMLWTAFNSSGRTLIVNSEISGPGSLFVFGDSKLQLMRDNSYEGITILTQATLRVGHDLALSTNDVVLGMGALLSTVSNAPRTLANAIVLADNVGLGATAIHNGVLTLSGGVDLGGVARTLNVYSQVEITGTVSNGGLARAQIGTLTLSGSNTYELGTTLGSSSGRLRVGNDDALGLGTVTMGRTTLTATGSVARVLTNHFVLTDNPSFGAASVDNGALTLNSINLGVATRTVTNHSPLVVSGIVSNGNWNKYGNGVLTLSGANTFTNFTINQGVLAFGADNVLGVGALDFQGGQIQAADGTARIVTNRVTLSAGTTIWGAAGTGDLTFENSAWNNGAAAKNLYVSNALTTINAPWTTINASVTKLGPGILAFGSTLAGSNWIVNGGTLRLDAGGDLTNVAAAVTVGADGIFDVAAKSGWQMLGRQVVRGSGSVAGDVLSADGAQFIPGSTAAMGTLTFSNALTLTAGTTNLFDLGTLTGIGGGTNDLIAVAGGLAAGSARIVVNPLQPLTTGSAYRLFTYGSLAGSFGGVDLPGTRYSGVLSEGGGVVDATFSGAPLALTWSGSAAAGVAGSTWDVTNAVNWQAGAEKFYTMDSVTFDESSPSNTVTLTGTIQPQSIVVAGASNYTFAGSGRITASTGIQKTGPGTLTVSTVNDFDGDVLVSGGVLKLGVVGALGSAAGSTIVTNGGTLDLNNKRYDNQNETFVFSGAGVGGTGAVVNTGADLVNQGLRNVTLTGDTTFGGPRRFDIYGSLLGGTNTFTKTGGAELVIWATNVSVGPVVINERFITVGSRQALGDTAFNTTVNNGAELRMYTAAGASLTTEEAVVYASGGTLTLNGAAAGTNTMTGPIGVSGGALTVSVGVVSYLEGAITGDQGFLKTGAAVLTLGGTNTYSGGTTIANGTLALGPNGSISNTPLISIAAGRLLDVSQVSGGWTLYAHQTLSGAASVLGNVIALGTIRPGASPGTMVYSNDLTLSGAAVEYELSDVATVGGGVNDLIDVKGNLTLTGVSTLSVVPWSGTLGSGYTFFTYGGTLTGDASNLSVVPGGTLRPGYSFLASTSTAGQITISVTGTEVSNLLWATGSGTWDVTNTVAWAGGQKFYQTDRVTFDDTGATGGDTNVVTFSERLLPGAITVNSASNYLVTGSGTIAGNAGLTKDGAGLLILGTSNEFSGATAILGGRVILGNANSLRYSAVSNAVPGGLGFDGATAFTLASLAGAGDVTLTNDAGAAVTLTLGGDNASTVFGGALGGGSGALTKNGTGTLTLTNSLAIGGNLMQNAGTIVLGGPVTNILGSDLRIATDSIASVVQNDGITVASGGNGILVGNGTGANGVYTLNGGILITHPATANRGVILGANSGSTGTFNLVGGIVTGKILEVSRSDANAPRSVGYFYQSGGTAAFANVTVAGGSVGNSSNNAALLAVSNGVFWTSAFGGFGSGNDSTGRIYLGSGAQATMPAFPVARGTNAYAELTFDGGTLTPLAASGGYMTNLSRVFLTTNGAIFNVPGGRDITVGSAIQPLENAAGQLGRLIKTGGGVLTLQGTNVYGGLTTVGAGAVTLGSTNALPGLFAAARYTVSSGAVLAVVNGITEGEVATMLGTGNFTANSFIGFDTSAGSRTNETVVADLGGNPLGLAKLGANTLLVTNTHTYTGGTRIFSGTIQVGDYGTFGSLGGGAMVNNGALVVTRSDAYAIPGDISGTGSLTKVAGDVLTLGGANTYSGATTVRKGTLQLGGASALSAASVLTLGDSTNVANAGTLDMNGNSGTIAGLVVTTPAGNNSTATNQIINLLPGRTLSLVNTGTGNALDMAEGTHLKVSGGGALAISATNADLYIRGARNATGPWMGLDVSALSSFSAVADQVFVGYDPNNVPHEGILILAETNAIRANAFHAGYSTQAGSVSGLVMLGRSTALNVANLYLGNGKGIGVMTFQDGLSSPTLTIAGTGVADRANAYLGRFTSDNSGTKPSGALLVTNAGASITAALDEMVLGDLRVKASSAANGAYGLFAFNEGAMDINTLIVGRVISNMTSGTGSGFLTMNGGTLDVNTAFVIGQKIGAGASTATGIVTLAGGVATMGVGILGGGGASALTLDGGTLDMQGNDIGSAGSLIGTLSFQSGTLMNVGGINDGAGLVKTGPGTLQLSGASTYTGPTLVSNGTLRVNGSSSGGGLISVYSGATLAGSGTVAVVTVAAGATLAPGNSAGTLTVGDLTLDGGATLEYDLGTSSDLIMAATTILGGIDFDNFTFLPGLGFGPGVYTLIDATSISGLGAGTTGTVDGLGATLSIDDGGQDLVLTVIPEPGTAGLLAAVGLAGWLLRRRRVR